MASIANTTSVSQPESTSSEIPSSVGKTVVRPNGRYLQPFLALQQFLSQISKSYKDANSYMTFPIGRLSKTTKAPFRTLMNPNTKSKSWDRRKQERDAMAIVKAKENELKQEKEEERQVIFPFNSLLIKFWCTHKLNWLTGFTETDTSHQRQASG